MNIFEAQALQTSCAYTRNTASGELDRRVFDLLTEFDLDPPSTLTILQDVHGYISGSGVLHIINPGPWKPNDIDIYVPSQGASKLKAFLLRVRRRFSFFKGINLEIRRRRGRTYTKIPGLSKIWYFQSLSTNRVINVMVTSTKSALPPIVAFHSTPVMNFIAYFGLVSLYGRMTSERIGWVNLDGPPSTRDRKWIAKYEERGYQLLANSAMHYNTDSHQCGVHLHCVQSERSLHNSGVRVATFAKHQGEKKSNLLRSLEPVLVWRLKNGNCHEVVVGDKGFVVTKYQHLLI
ncbi:hypothetical protein BKA70DRAFT_1100657 [Coprinopsis sp. MPI-PUGE-AT-0042]|nr:hypothetical protein BKA70DRAFT_1100657 [Coprinopsis sp. MPI-PUGE-AT-0042]